MLIRDIAHISDEFIAIYCHSDQEMTYIIDRNAANIISKEYGTKKFVGLTDGLMLSFDDTNRCTIVNSNFEILKRKFLVSQQIHAEVLNDRLIATSDGDDIILLRIYVNNFAIVVSECSESSSSLPILGLKRLSNRNFASFTVEVIKIWDCDGNLALEIKNEKDGQDIKSVDALDERFLLCSIYENEEKMIKIWNFLNGELIKEMKDSELVGVCHYGFLVRSKENRVQLDCYSLKGDFLGICFTDGFSQNGIERIKHLHENLYAIFVKEKHEFKLFRSKLNKFKKKCFKIFESLVFQRRQYRPQLCNQKIKKVCFL